MNQNFLAIPVPTIRMVQFQRRLLTVYFVIDNAFILLSQPDVKNAIYYRMVSGRESLKDGYRKWKKGKLHKDDESLLKDLDEKDKLLQESYRKVLTEENLGVILNQGLVMVCTVFEAFLNDTFRTLINEKQEALKTLRDKVEAGKNGVVGKLKFVCNTRNLSSIKKKVIEKFNWLGVMEKLVIMELLEIPQNGIFDFSNPPFEIGRNCANWDKGKLIDIVNKRNDIVHRDALPLKNLDELSEVESFVEGLVINISILISNRYKIVRDSDFISRLKEDYFKGN